MRCDGARAAISERMDGERLSSRAAPALDRHLAGCEACRAWEQRAGALRVAVRIRPAEPIPDLVDPIMAAIRAEVDAPTPILPPKPKQRWLAPAAAALLAGAVLGSALVGGPWSRDEPPSIATANVTREVTAAARRLDAYRATFLVTERNVDEQTAVRELTMQVRFHAPNRFRLDVVDPAGGTEARQPNDLSLVVNADAWALRAPTACPPGLGRACPGSRTTIRPRTALAATGGLPTDLVVPLDTLVAAPDVQVLGRDELLGREAIRLGLRVERAAPLLAFTRLGGTWRPLFPGDRVDLWVDAESWFPLRFRVLPAGGARRAAWERRFGLPEEPVGRAVLEVTAVRMDERPAPAGVFEVPARGGGGGTIPLPAPGYVVEGGDLDEALASSELPGGPAPAELAGLPARAAEVRSAEALVAYGDGLTWLHLGRRSPDEAHEGPFGPVDRFAEEVVLADGGLAYFEPAGRERGRRLAIHTADGDLYLESNLPRAELLRVAAELGATGRPLPAAWTTRTGGGETSRRVELEEAADTLGFPVLVPAEEALPEGYTFASAELIGADGRRSLTLRYRQRASDLAGPPIRIHLEDDAALPPASSARQLAIRLPDGSTGRWTPSRDRLELVIEGTYVSLDGLERPELVRLAASLGEVEP